MKKLMPSESFQRCAILLAWAMALAGCVGRNESKIGSSQEPLIVLLSPAHAPEAPEPLRALERSLSSRAGLSVVVRIASSPVDAIEQFGTRRADAGILTLDEFLLAREEYGVRALRQALRGQGAAQYDGVILVRSDSKAKGVRDLNGRKFAFVDPYSVSGFLLPARHLQQAGVAVEARFVGSHGRALAALLRGDVAAIATYADLAAGRRDVRVLTRTGTVPNEPLIFRSGLRPDKREALAAAFQDLAGDTQGRQALLAVADITGWGPVDGEAYRAVHELLRAAGKSVYDIVPDGTEIKRLNQPYLDAR